MSKDKKNTSNKAETLVIELPNKVVRLLFIPFDTDINTDELCQIHHHNIMGEIMTCAAALNRIGNLRAEIENIVAEQKLDFDIFMAMEKTTQRKKLTFDTTDSKGKAKVDKPSADEVETAVLITPAYKVKKKHLLNLEKNLKIVESLYWSMKDKSDKVTRLTEKLRPEDFEKDLVEESINGFMLTMHKKSIN